MIEPFHREEKIEGSSDRTFGLVMAAFFGVVTIWPLLHASTIRTWALIPGVAFLALALIRPHALARLNHLWMRLGMMLNKVVSPIALGIVFYLTVFPLGMLLRLLGKDPLRLKPDPSANSYWILRDPPGPYPKSMDRQF